MQISDDIKQNIINDMYADLDAYLNSNPVIDITIDKSDTDDYYENGLHCSRLGWCVRSEVMSYYNFPKKPVNLQTNLTFMRGNFYHELVYKWLLQSKRFKYIVSEFAVPRLPEPYCGKADIFFMDLKLGFGILADIKTANSNLFKKYSNFLPKEDNIKQLSAYALKPYLDLEYNLLLMMYFSSGSDHPQFYFVEPYKDIEAEMQKYIIAVKKYEDTKILPPQLDADFNSDQAWQCSYCDFNGISCEGLIGDKPKKKGK